MAINVKRTKLTHTRERKKRKNEPIPAPKYPVKITRKEFEGAIT